MKPIKPKYCNMVKTQWKVSKRTKAIVTQYAKYTKYDENEIVDMVLSEILADEEFVKWLKSRRFQKKINETIFGKSDDSILNRDEKSEETKEDSKDI